jgi:DNA-binding NarL/FixJ family response regulator
MRANDSSRYGGERSEESSSHRRAVRLPDLLSSDEWCRLSRALNLSQRQSEILRCAFSDERDSSIAERLGVSAHTIHTQRMRLFRKLHVASMTQAIAVAATTWFELTL